MPIANPKYLTARYTASCRIQNRKKKFVIGIPTSTTCLKVFLATEPQDGEYSGVRQWSTAILLQ